MSHETRRPTFWEHDDLTDYMTQLEVENDRLRSRLDDAVLVLKQIDASETVVTWPECDALDTFLKRAEATRASL